MNAGDRVAHFEIVSLLGSGAMGKVFHAMDSSLQRSVALKLLPPDMFTDRLMKERFLREARAIAQLEHANIVRIYEFGEFQESYFMAMEYLTGGSIGDALKGGKVYDQDSAVKIGISIASGLGAAHSAGIVHRDVKPDNLMFSRTGELKIVDLGLARSQQDGKPLTVAGAILGTPHYMAPEQILGDGQISGQADIYALGITLYHMVTGQTPYSGESVRQIVKAHLTQKLPDPRKLAPEVTPALYELLLKMTACERHDRTPDMAAVVQGLQELGSQTRPVVQPPPPIVPKINLSLSPPPKDPAEATVMLEPVKPATPCYSEEQLRLLERQLARHIGPLAKILVKRSATSATSFPELAQRLAEQIPNVGEREAFLKEVDVRP